jgi:hypothetical protein
MTLTVLFTALGVPCISLASLTLQRNVAQAQDI